MPRSEVTLRPAVVADAGEIVTLQRAAWLSEGRRHDTFDIPPLTESVSDVARVLDTWTAFVAVDPARHDRIVGSVRATLDGDALYPGVWWVGRLGVVPDRQGEGIGGVLLAAAEAAAPAGTPRAALTTGPKSDDNIAFYERHGYVHTPAPDGHPFSFLAHLVKELETP